MAKIIKFAEENYRFQIFSLAETFMQGEFEKFKYLAEDAMDLQIQFCINLEIACSKSNLDKVAKIKLYKKLVKEVTYSMYRDIIPRMLGSKPFNGGQFNKSDSPSGVKCDNLVLYYDDQPLILAIYNDIEEYSQEWLEVFYVSKEMAECLNLTHEQIRKMVHDMLTYAIERFDHGSEAYQMIRPPINILSSQKTYFDTLASWNSWVLAPSKKNFGEALISYNC